MKTILPIFAILLAGCVSARPETIIVSEDLGLVKMEYNDVSGWWAPQATWVEVLGAWRSWNREP